MRCRCARAWCENVHFIHFSPVEQLHWLRQAVEYAVQVCSLVMMLTDFMFIEWRFFAPNGPIDLTFTSSLMF